MPLNKELVAALPKGEYRLENGLLKQVNERVGYQLTSEGGFVELMREYDLILKKQSRASAKHREVILDKISLLKFKSRNRQFWHKHIYPYDYNGEFTKLLRS